MGPPDGRDSQQSGAQRGARGAEASLITAMGRMARHTGQVITRDQMLACTHEFAPQVDRLTLGPAPLVAVDGRYPVPL